MPQQPSHALAELGLVKGLTRVAITEPRVQGWSKTQRLQHGERCSEDFGDVLSPAGPVEKVLRR